MWWKSIWIRYDVYEWPIAGIQKGEVMSDRILTLEVLEERISKLVIGFISDVIGPVSMPMYTVCLNKNIAFQLLLCLH